MASREALLLVLSALVVGWLPGAIVFRLPGRARALRAALAAEERAFWAVLLSLIWSIAVVLALGAIGEYAFERLITVNVAVAATLVVLFRGRLRWTPPAARPTPTVLLPLALIALGGFLYFPPSEVIAGGKDPGVYINEGIQIAQRGQVIITDETVRAVPTRFRDLFFPSHEQRWYYGIRFMGFFIQDPDQGTVVGQFPHVFPASIAIGYGLHGLSGAREAIVVWAILGLLAVYFTASHLVGRRTAFVGVTLLAINVVSVWFGRYPNSEIVLQTLLFAAMLAFAYTLQGSRVFFGIVAGAMIGASMFLRYEVILAWLAFGAAAALAAVQRLRVGAPFWIALAVTGAAGLWYLQGPLRAYGYYPLGFTRNYGVLPLLGFTAATVVLHRSFRWERWRAFFERVVPWAFAFTIVGLSTYAYFFRTPGAGVAPADAMAFRSFGWYVGPAVLFAAVVAAALASVRAFWRSPVFFVTFAAFSVFFFYKTRIVPEHFWAGRRNLAVTLPAALVFLAAAADCLASGTRFFRKAGRARDAVTTVAMAALLAPVAVSFWRASSPLLAHVEHAGLIPRVEQLASRFGERDLVIVESRNAGSDLHMLALPLAYIYARQVLVLDSAAPPKPLFEEFLTWADAKYENVFFLGGGGTDLLTGGTTAEPVLSDRFEIAEYESRLNALPEGLRRKDFEFGIYRLIVGRPARGATVAVEIGGSDDVNVVRFHARERSAEGVAFRWSGAQSFVVLPAVPESASEVVVWMGTNGRPPAAPQAVVAVAFDDEPIGEVTVTGDIQPYRFSLPPTVLERIAGRSEPVRLRLRSTTWRPSTFLGVNDPRDLGVAVTRVEVRGSR